MKRKDFRRGSLTEQEARERLELADQTVVTELYDFGKMLLNEAVARVSRLDTKATYHAAYSIGVITLLVSTNSGWANRIHVVWLPMSAGVIAFVSAICAVAALTLRDFKWFNDNDWLRTECLASEGSLRQYRVLSMMAMIDSWETAAYRKSLWITSAQLGLMIAALFLVASLIDALITL